MIQLAQNAKRAYAATFGDIPEENPRAHSFEESLVTRPRATLEGSIASATPVPLARVDRVGSVALLPGHRLPCSQGAPSAN